MGGRTVMPGPKSGYYLRRRSFTIYYYLRQKPILTTQNFSKKILGKILFFCSSNGSRRQGRDRREAARPIPRELEGAQPRHGTRKKKGRGESGGWAPAKPYEQGSRHVRARRPRPPEARGSIPGQGGQFFFFSAFAVPPPLLSHPPSPVPDM